MSELCEAAWRAICKHFNADPDKIWGNVPEWSLVRYVATCADYEARAARELATPTPTKEER